MDRETTRRLWRLYRRVALFALGFIIGDVIYYAVWVW